MCIPLRAITGEGGRVPAFGCDPHVACENWLLRGLRLFLGLDGRRLGVRCVTTEPPFDHAVRDFTFAHHGEIGAKPA